VLNNILSLLSFNGYHKDFVLAFFFGFARETYSKDFHSPYPRGLLTPQLKQWVEIE